MQQDNQDYQDQLAREEAETFAAQLLGYAENPTEEAADDFNRMAEQKSGEITLDRLAVSFMNMPHAIDETAKGIELRVAKALGSLGGPPPKQRDPKLGPLEKEEIVENWTQLERSTQGGSVAAETHGGSGSVVAEATISKGALWYV